MTTTAAGLNSSDSKEAKEVFTKVLSRMALFEALPPSILPALVSVRTKVDLPKTADRKLLRIVNYLVQLAAGEGSAGTVVPFSTLLGERHTEHSATCDADTELLRQLDASEGESRRRNKPCCCCAMQARRCRPLQRMSSSTMRWVLFTRTASRSRQHTTSEQQHSGQGCAMLAAAAAAAYHNCSTDSRATTHQQQRRRLPGD